MAADRFTEPIMFETGVWWRPDGYKSIDQTPYLEYLEKHGSDIEAIRNSQEKQAS